MSDAIRKWEKHASRIVSDHRIFKIREDRTTNPRTGSEHDMVVLECPGWVNILALTPERDVVFVELPDGGARFGKMDVFGTIEAVKAVSDLYCPLEGEIVAVNDELDDDPSIVNSDPYGAGWMIKLKLADPSEVSSLLSADSYAEHIG